MANRGAAQKLGPPSRKQARITNLAKPAGRSKKKKKHYNRKEGEKARVDLDGLTGSQLQGGRRRILTGERLASTRLKAEPEEERRGEGKKRMLK